MRKIFSIMLLCATVVLASCKTSGSEEESVNPVTGVKVDPSSITLGVGEGQTVNAIVSPSNADDMTITWSSSEPTVATVDEQGNIKAIKVGTAVITATSNADKTKLGTCNVTVTSEPIVAVSSVSLNKTTLSLTIGGTETLVATVEPENAPNKSVTWTSSAIDVATVSATGEVKAIKAGTATITVTSASDNTKTAACVVTVVSEPIVAVSNVSLNKTTLSLAIGGAEILVATVKPENAPDKSVTWTSNATDVATVSATGEVKAIKAGTATIMATSVSNNTKTAACTVTVTAPAKVYAVGDSYPNETSRIGIVFWVDPTDATKGKIMNLMGPLESIWSTEKITTGATSTSNGAENSAKVLALNTYSAEKYPALAHCAEQNTPPTAGINWYLPSKDELKALFDVRQIINNIPGVSGLSNTTYWSSSEAKYNEVWIMNFGNGGVDSDDKNAKNMLRFISAF